MALGDGQQEVGDVIPEIIEATGENPDRQAIGKNVVKAALDLKASGNVPPDVLAKSTVQVAKDLGAYPKPEEIEQKSLLRNIIEKIRSL